MSSYLLLTVFVMAVMTYLPRMLPLTFFKKEIHSRFIRSLLYYVPYAVLSALTFPSILYATGLLWLEDWRVFTSLIVKKAWFLLPV